MTNRKLKILIIRLGALGDVIHGLPALRILRSAFPKAHIDWLVEEGSAPLLRDHPDLDGLVVMERKKWQQNLRAGREIRSTFREIRKAFQKLRSTRYDWIIDFHGNLRSGLLLTLARGRRKMGFSAPISREASHIFLHQSFDVDFNIHKTERSVRLLEKIFPLSIDRIPQPFFPFKKAPQTKIQHWLDSLPAKKKILVIHPGVSTAYSIKRWSPKFYVQLITMVLNELDLLVVLTWGPGERPLVDSIAKEVALPIFPTAEVLSLEEMVALLQRAQLFLASDTGPLHLATSLGIPAVGLYGPKPPSIYRPFFTGEALISHTQPCAPCNHKRCPFGGEITPCMADLSPHLVFQALQRQLFTKGEFHG